ncbi:MAG: helix-turn-helix domain-containing protein [Proteobacteria bacterium]|nr:helix-turn-helix domain-containing protein [Pseudomonadota bacterium]
MKQFNQFNYYEILDIPITSTLFEIRNAYQNAVSTYSEDSLITYSFFSEDEREEILKTIDHAFYTLIDENKKAEYDEMLQKKEGIDVDSIQASRKKKPIAIFDRSKSINVNTFVEKVRTKIDDDQIKEISNTILSKETISGNDIKELREKIGIELEEIFEIERISVSILKSIEGDQVDQLPSPIYLKNFLKSYAEVLHLDSKVLVDGYLKNIRQVEQGKQRHRKHADGRVRLHRG